MKPSALKRVYVGWMALALVLGAIISTILLAVIFYVLVTPLSVAARAFGKDFLTRRQSDAPSYWIVRPKSRTRKPADYELQY